MSFPQRDSVTFIEQQDPSRNIFFKRSFKTENHVLSSILPFKSR